MTKFPSNHALELETSSLRDDNVNVLQLLARIGEETLNTPVYVQVEAGQCHVMTECLMRYALIGQPSSAGCKAVKLLQVAVFAPAVSAVATVPFYNLRIYFVDDTADAFEVA